MAGIKGMKGGGGARANAGGYRVAGKKVTDILGENAKGTPQRAPPQTYHLDGEDEIKFLESVMKDNEIDIRIRMDAAKNLARLKSKKTPLGKKALLKEDAQELGRGKYGIGAAPKTFPASK